MPVLLPVSRVLALCHPLEDSPWDTEPVTKEMVAEALSLGLEVSHPIPSDAHARAQAARIAFLVRHGWDDAIEIDVGIPSMQFQVDWPVIDGNHRLAAAAYRGDADILASVGGCLDKAFELFGVECQEDMCNV